MSALRKFLTFRRVRFIVLLALLALSAFVLHLDITIRAQFEGRRWALPARVYARPLELYAGMKLTPEVLEAELRRLDYRSTAGARFPYVGGEDPGTYHRYGDGNEFDFTTRAFMFPDRAQAALPLHAEFSEGHLSTLLDRRTGEAVTLARLDALLIGSIYPAHHEDRVLVQLRSVPQALADALTPDEMKRSQVYPEVARLREVTRRVAVAVVRQADLDGVGRRFDDEALDEVVAEAMWSPAYPELVPV